MRKLVRLGNAGAFQCSSVGLSRYAHGVISKANLLEFRPCFSAFVRTSVMLLLRHGSLQKMAVMLPPPKVAVTVLRRNLELL